MMRRGIMFFDFGKQEWNIWIGQQAYEIVQGMSVEIRIQNRYFRTCMEKDSPDWLITIENEVTFTLSLFEVYRVRVLQMDLIPAFNLPF
ncbi:DUF5348 domain-containing protein [Ornithinibacillus sp. FSL M8-0202]|uniref:DUF5348 domain-containing protein n=1 Tax=Bacillaceae TaxID=186817 RepID=UPI0030CDEDA2